MAYKFEDLEVWKRSLDYADTVHEIADELPKHERYNDRDRGRQSAVGGGALPAIKRTY
ncbi:four helix bundle protein [Salinibacter ruber]|uniref:four helix bundle protein n=1 Tax=Salinibacter ruber TaxID=146919 RepID=UPI002072EAF7|nr:four helix bundle protein [Salinibacter ruber]